MGILNSPAQLNACYTVRTPARGLIKSNLFINLGTTSISSQASDHPDIAATRSSAGVYTLTFPPSYQVAIVKCEEIYSPARTVVGLVTTAKNVSAGTATITAVNNAGAATDPANGDQLVIGLELGSEA